MEKKERINDNIKELRCNFLQFNQQIISSRFQCSSVGTNMVTTPERCNQEKKLKNLDVKLKNFEIKASAILPPPL